VILRLALPGVETIRRWVLKFGSGFARSLRRLRPRPTGTWHLDEMVVLIQGRRVYLWRAVDREGGDQRPSQWGVLVFAGQSARALLRSHDRLPCGAANLSSVV
jgi:hypothetical protein